MSYLSQLITAAVPIVEQKSRFLANIFSSSDQNTFKFYIMTGYLYIQYIMISFGGKYETNDGFTPLKHPT